MTLKTLYNENIVQAGESILSTPAVVYSMTVSCDIPAATIIKFFDGTSTSGDVAEKVVLTTGTPTIHLCYPKGKKFGTAIYATSSTSATCNVSIDYE